MMRGAWKKVTVLALCALLPATMAPTGGLPSRPRFQQVTAIVANAGTQSGMRAASTTPAFNWYETDGAANNRSWDLVASAEQLLGRVGLDNDSGFTNWLTVDRTGTTVDNVNLQATNVQVNGSNVCRANGTGCPAFPVVASGRFSDNGASCTTVFSTNVASCTRTGTGTLQITMSFSSATAPSCTATSVGTRLLTNVSASTATTSTFETLNSSTLALTAGGINIVCIQ